MTFDAGDGNTVSNMVIDTTTVNGIYSFQSTSGSDNLSISNVQISNIGNAGFYGRDADGYVLNNISVTNAGTHSFAVSNLTNLSGTGNVSVAPRFNNCNTGGVNSGSFTVNGASCP